MPATPLPSTGLSLRNNARTCDASGMVVIHRMLKRSFDEAVGLVEGVAEGDTRHAMFVTTQLRLISTVMHAHHEGEESIVWEKLDARVPACTMHVERMRAQHTVLLAHLEDLDRAVLVWCNAPGAETSKPVRQALQGITQALAIHFPDEEKTVIPLMEQVITQTEEDSFSEHGRRAVPKHQAGIMLGAILSAQPDRGTAWLKKNLPTSAVLQWFGAGAAEYARFRAAIAGRDRFTLP